MEANSEAASPLRVQREARLAGPLALPRAKGWHSDTNYAPPGRELIPAEEPDAEESGFEEEGGKSLQSQRGAEDISHEAGVFRPVHSKMEFLHDTCYDAHSEVDEKNRAEEFHELQAGFFPFLAFGMDIAGL